MDRLIGDLAARRSGQGDASTMGIEADISPS
jgi:hypothetical protein